jgi:hypothetical protein
MTKSPVVFNFCFFISPKVLHIGLSKVQLDFPRAGHHVPHLARGLDLPLLRWGPTRGQHGGHVRLR